MFLRKTNSENMTYILNKIENRLIERHKNGISTILRETNLVADIIKLNGKLLQLEGINLKLKGNLELEDPGESSDESELEELADSKNYVVELEDSDESDLSLNESDFEEEPSWQPDNHRLEDIIEETEDENAYLDENQFRENGISLQYKTYDYPNYPQLWGNFLGNVSVLDLIANTGKEARQFLKSQSNNIIPVS